MKAKIFGAGTDLGVHIDGASLGPNELINHIKLYDNESIILNQDKDYVKSKDSNDLRKNENEIDKFNTNLYNNIVNCNDFSIMVGGDHSAAVASALASQAKHGDIGVIWIDAHTDYNTFETTITGNIHGLPLAAIDGYKCDELRKFHNGNTVSPTKTVVVGARSVDPLEYENLKDANVTVFTRDDIREKGMEYIMGEAFKIAGDKIHISYDLDVIDPNIAPGVSIPEVDGISKVEAYEINNFLMNNIDNIVSFDLVEFNPTKDINNMTRDIAANILNDIIYAVNEIKNDN